ncbi:MAG: BamA/TamA family outer membrane protein, partial [Novosphingobium sp.]
GFDIRGVGPRVLRKYYTDVDGDGTIGPNEFSPDRNSWTDDALGGRMYYLARAELEIPLGAGARELGIRPSIFVDAGAVFGLRAPVTLDTGPGGQFVAQRDSSGVPLYNVTCNGATTTVPGASTPSLPATCTAMGDVVTPLGTSYAFRETFGGNSARPRVSIGIGFNWNSPMGPFRIDFAKALLRDKEFDDTKSFTFNVGTQF